MTKISNQYSLTNILTADLANSRLGINNVSPAYSLDVTGAARVSTSAYLATASGSVGIGTTSPSYKLDVLGSSGALAKFSDGTTSTFIYSGSGVSCIGADLNINNGLIITGASNIAQINTNGTERMRITSAGNVGIGTSAPSDKLSVVGGGIYTDGNIYSAGRTKSVAGLVSADGFIGIPINTWTTFYTMPGVGIYSALIDIETYEDINQFGAYCIVFASNSNTSVPVSFNGSLVSIRVSGMNIQCLLSTGLGYARTMYYKILRT